MQAVHLSSFLPSSAPFTALHPSPHPFPTHKEDDLIIRITHVAIQQVDLLYARGRHQNNNPKRGHIHPPFTLGLDFAGTVLSTSNPSFKPGDRVFGSAPGAFATHLVCPASAVHHVPASLTTRSAAALAGGVVSFAAVRDIARVQAGQTVLVTGVPGNLAVVAAQVAVARGARVFALARNGVRAEAVRSKLKGSEVLGADGDWTSEIMQRTDRKGVDVVIDNVGLVRESLGVLVFGGIVVLVGFAGRGGVMEKVEMNRVLLKGARVVGFRYGEGIRRGLFDGEHCWKGYLDAVASGNMEAVVDPKLYKGLEAVGKAMEDLEKGRLVGKAVVSLEDDRRSSRL